MTDTQERAGLPPLNPPPKMARADALRRLAALIEADPSAGAQRPIVVRETVHDHAVWLAKARHFDCPVVEDAPRAPGRLAARAVIGVGLEYEVVISVDTILGRDVDAERNDCRAALQRDLDQARRSTR